LHLALCLNRHAGVSFHFSKLFDGHDAKFPWHISSVTTGMTNNSRYQISSRSDANVLPKFGKATRWNIFMENLRSQMTLLVQAPIQSSLTALDPSSTGKNNHGFAKARRFSSLHGLAANSMDVSAFNSQLG